VCEKKREDHLFFKQKLNRQRKGGPRKWEGIVCEEKERGSGFF
jgi:hypothetical protein